MGRLGGRGLGVVSIAGEIGAWLRIAGERGLSVFAFFSLDLPGGV